MLALMALRWLMPSPPALTAASAMPAGSGAQDLVAALDAVAAPAVASASSDAVALEERELDVAGDAFVVRPPRTELPPPAPAPVAQPQTTELSGTPDPPPLVVEPSPALQVIGTWDESGVLGVFVASPNGTLLAQKGAVLMAEYRVSEVSKEQLVLEHVTSGREYRLDVPRASRR